MASKKYSGAPFGTQTARFDVSGVHPKSKLPGTFTQIPYDKFSMIEKKEKERLSESSSRSSKDRRDKSLRYRYVHDPDASFSRIDRVDNNLKSARTALESVKKNMVAIERIRSQRSSKSSYYSNSTGKSSVASKLENFTMEEMDENEKINDKVKFSIQDTDQCENSDDDNNSDDKNNACSSSKNTNASNKEDDVVTSTTSTTGQTSKRISFDLHNGSSIKVLIAESSNKKVKETEVLSLKETLKDVRDNLNTASTMALDTEGGGGLHDTGVYKNPKVMKNTPTNQSDLGTPVNSKESLAFIAQQKRLEIKNLGLPCHEILKRKLGPGAYNTMMGTFGAAAVEQKASGPGWARQLEVERLAALPHLLYKEQWEENKMLKRKLGPGSYEIKDFIQMSSLKPRSSKGVCENLATRMDKGIPSFTPGPGTYGIGGIPQKAIEEKNQLSHSTKGMLDSGDRKRHLPSVGSHLGPGTYRHKTCTEEMLNKVTSLKGPYDLYSGDRNKPITDGYQAAPKLADLGPGQYEIGSFVDELNSTHKRTHGGFGKMVQYPDIPTERLFLFSQAHCPNKKLTPGPGAYSMQEISKLEAVNSPGFLSSAKRDDKISQKFFTRNFNPVGAGRYDIQKYQDAQDINGHGSAFKSKTGKPNLQMAKFLQERMRAKDIPAERRMVLCETTQPQALSRSLTVA